jgi:hypothetical protein
MVPAREAAPRPAKVGPCTLASLSAVPSAVRSRSARRSRSPPARAVATRQPTRSPRPALPASESPSSAPPGSPPSSSRPPSASSPSTPSPRPRPAGDPVVVGVVAAGSRRRGHRVPPRRDALVSERDRGRIVGSDGAVPSARSATCRASTPAAKRPAGTRGCRRRSPRTGWSSRTSPRADDNRVVRDALRRERSAERAAPHRLGNPEGRAVHNGGGSRSADGFLSHRDGRRG